MLVAEKLQEERLPTRCLVCSCELGGQPYLPIGVLPLLGCVGLDEDMKIDPGDTGVFISCVCEDCIDGVSDRSTNMLLLKDLGIVVAQIEHAHDVQSLPSSDEND